MLGKIQMVDVVPAPPNPESQVPPHPSRIPVSFSPRVNVVRPRDRSRRFLTHSDSHQSTHDESAESPRMRNEPESSSCDGQPSRVDAPDHAVKPGDVEMPSEEFEVGASDENPNSQRVPDEPSDEKSVCWTRVAVAPIF